MTRAIRFNRSSVLYVPKRIIPEHERADVLEVKICGVREDDTLDKRSYLIYTLHNPSYRRAFLSLFQLRPRPGERFAILSVRKYGLKDFVDDYDRDKPAGLDNVGLLCTNCGLAMRVGELEIPLQFSLGSYRGEVHLEASFTDGPGARFRVIKSVSSFRARLKRDRESITSIDSDSGRLLVRYPSSHYPGKEHVRVLEIETASTTELEEPSGGERNRKTP